MDSPIASSQVAETIAAIKGIPTKEALRELLSTSLVQVTFNKLSGEERKMACTLIPEYLPEAKKEDHLSQIKVRNLNEDTFVVWDIRLLDWRSFRYDRVTKVGLITPVMLK